MSPPAEERITALECHRAPYPIDKMAAHRDGVRHLAVSVFVFRGRELLLQRRADGKYHSGGLWANTCCSHPRWGEDVGACAQRRLQEELGWRVPLAWCGTLEYRTPVGALYEHELVHCFFGQALEAVPLEAFDPAEVQALAWQPLEAIAAAVVAEPERFAPWFVIYLREHRALLEAWPARRPPGDQPPPPAR